MSSVDFFVIMAGAYKEADEAFDQAVKDAQSKKGNDKTTGAIAGKKYFKEVEVPKRKDPLVFAKESAEDHGNNFP